MWPAIVVSGFSRPEADAGLGEAVHAALASHSIAAIDEPSDDQWRIYFTDSIVRDQALADLRTRLPHLRIDILDVPDEDWAARSQAALRAVQIGRIIVAPPGPTLAERIVARARALPPGTFDKLPDDLASQHDHYLYGTPKRPE